MFSSARVDGFPIGDLKAPGVFLHECMCVVDPESIVPAGPAFLKAYHWSVDGDSLVRAHLSLRFAHPFNKGDAIEWGPSRLSLTISRVTIGRFADDSWCFRIDGGRMREQTFGDIGCEPAIAGKRAFQTL